MEETKICPKCGKEVLAVAKKCKYCDYWFEKKDSTTPRYRRCTVCSELIPDGASVCPYCDEPVEITEIVTTPIEAAAPAGRQREKVHEESRNINPDRPEVKPEDKKSCSKAAAVAVVAVIVLIVAGVLLLISKSNKQGNDYKVPVAPVVMTDEDMATEVAEKWNMYHQRMNADGLAPLYADEVYYYHETYTPKRITENKRGLFLKYPEFRQEISNVECSFMTDGSAKVTFSKEVITKTGGKPKSYPSYLVMKKIGGVWKITVESDEVTDANLVKRKN